MAAQAGPRGLREDVFYFIESGTHAGTYLYNKVLDVFERVDEGKGLAMHISRSCAQDAKTKRLSLLEVRPPADTVPQRCRFWTCSVTLDEHHTARVPQCKLLGPLLTYREAGASLDSSVAEWISSTQSSPEQQKFLEDKVLKKICQPTYPTRHP